MPWVLPEHTDHPEEDRRYYFGIAPGALPWNRDDVAKLLRRLRHPARWVRWRVQLHRAGPYTPDFEEFVRGPTDDG